MQRDEHLEKVPERDFVHLGSEELWRLIVIARRSRYQHDRRRGEAAARMLLAREMPRVRALIAAFRSPRSAWVRIDREDRDVVAQLAFIQLLTLIDSFRGDRLVQFYKAIRPCVNFVCLRFLSKEFSAADRMAAPEDEDWSSRVVDPHAQDETEQLALRDALERAIDAIPSEDQRQVLRLTFFEGLTSQEIAARLDSRVNTVDQHRRRALGWLRKNRPELATLGAT
jgi:RNA polymerase sigma factor (sigma-70 family)